MAADKDTNQNFIEYWRTEHPNLGHVLVFRFGLHLLGIVVSVHLGVLSL